MFEKYNTWHKWLKPNKTRVVSPFGAIAVPTAKIGLGIIQVAFGGPTEHCWLDFFLFKEH